MMESLKMIAALIFGAWLAFVVVMYTTEKCTVESPRGPTIGSVIKMWGC
jgi:hypothetical protein